MEIVIELGLHCSKFSLTYKHRIPRSSSNCQLKQKLHPVLQQLILPLERQPLSTTCIKNQTLSTEAWLFQQGKQMQPQIKTIVKVELKVAKQIKNQGSIVPSYLWNIGFVVCLIYNSWSFRQYNSICRLARSSRRLCGCFGAFCFL